MIKMKNHQKRSLDTFLEKISGLYNFLEDSKNCDKEYRSNIRWYCTDRANRYCKKYMLESNQRLESGTKEHSKRSQQGSIP